MVGAFPQITKPPQSLAAGDSDPEVITTGLEAVPFTFIFPPCATAIKELVPPVALINVPAGILSVPPSFIMNEEVNKYSIDELSVTSVSISPCRFALVEATAVKPLVQPVVHDGGAAPFPAPEVAPSTNHEVSPT